MSQVKAKAPITPSGIVSSGQPIRVIIVENHQLVSESLGALLDAQTDMEVVARASSVAEASTLSRGLAPHLVVMDFHLGDGTGHEAAIAMRDLYPNVKFVFLSRDETEDAQLAAVEAGAAAYVHKSTPANDLVRAIRDVARGASLFTPATIARLVARGRDREHMRESLSPRELEVLQLLADGIATREIAKQLGISYSTVRTHVRSISHKLGARSMVSAVVTARELELVN